MRLRNPPPDFLPVAAIVMTVLVANSLYLSGHFLENPLYWLSELLDGGKGGPFLGQQTIDPSTGWVSQASGHVAAMDLLHGHFPWWNPYEGPGVPLLGEMQSASLFPLTVLYLFGNGQLYLHMVLELISGIATYFLLRRFTEHKWVAAIGGMVYAINGTFAWLGHAPANVVPFLPVMLLGIERTRDATLANRRCGWGLISVGLSLSLLGGFPETTYWGLLLAFTWAALRLGQTPAADRVRYVLKGGAGVVAGLMIAAPIVGAAVAYLRVADHSQSSAAAAFSLADPHAFSTIVVPYIFGPIGGFSGYETTSTAVAVNYNHGADIASTWNTVGGYLGASMILLALIGLFGKRHRSLRLVLAIFLLVMTGRATGFYPVIHLLSVIPGSFSNFYRFAPATCEFAVVVLACLGIDDLVSSNVRLRTLLIAALGTTLIAVAALAEAWPVVRRVHGAPHYGAWVMISIAIVVLCIIAVTAVAKWARGPAKLVLLGVLLVGETLAYFEVPQFSALEQASVDMGPIAFLQAHLGVQRFFSLGPITPNYGSYFGLAALNSADNPVPKVWAEYVVNRLNPAASAYGFNGTSYWDTPESPSPVEEMLLHLRGYEMSGVKYVVAPTSLAMPADAARLGVHKVFADPTVSIYELSRYRSFFSVTTGACTLSPRDYDTLTAVCRSRSTLEREELHMPGSGATVNGQPAVVSSAGPIFQAVTLPAGTSRVTFYYRPAGSSLLIGAALIGIAWLVGMCWISLRHSARRGRAAPDSSRRRPEEAAATP